MRVLFGLTLGLALSVGTGSAWAQTNCPPNCSLPNAAVTGPTSGVPSITYNPRGGAYEAGELRGRLQTALRTNPDRFDLRVRQNSASMPAAIWPFIADVSSARREVRVRTTRIQSRSLGSDGNDALTLFQQGCTVAGQFVNLLGPFGATTEVACGLLSVWSGGGGSRAAPWRNYNLVVSLSEQDGVACVTGVEFHRNNSAGWTSASQNLPLLTHIDVRDHTQIAVCSFQGAVD